MTVPFLDFTAAYTELKAELDEAYERFMSSGWYVLGNEVSAFEAEYADYCESPHCVGVGSGLEALHLALLAAECGSGDEVIVPANTYIATWLAVTQVGAIPVPVEPSAGTFNIDPDRIAAAITSRTKAILAVNLYGQPCDYDRLLQISKDLKIKLVIDNAQAQGARYKGRRVGGIADIECHSFYPSKNLGAFGEAGAVTTHDEIIADRIRVLRNYGSRVRYHHESIGFNARIDELQAAFLRVKLRYLDEWNRRRRVVASLYGAEMRGNGCDLPLVPEWAESVWHLYVVRHPDRDRLAETLRNADIASLIHYPIPPHLSMAYRHLGYGPGDFPITETLSEQILSLPIGPHLSIPQARKVVEAANSA